MGHLRDKTHRYGEIRVLVPNHDKDATSIGVEDVHLHAWVQGLIRSKCSMKWNIDTSRDAASIESARHSHQGTIAVSSLLLCACISTHNMKPQ